MPVILIALTFKRQQNTGCVTLVDKCKYEETDRVREMGRNMDEMVRERERESSRDGYK